MYLSPICLYYTICPLSVCTILYYYNAPNILYESFALQQAKQYLMLKIDQSSNLIWFKIYSLSKVVCYFITSKVMLTVAFQYVGAPSAYIQQIIVKSVVSPWDSRQLIQSDAFRAPLSKAFDIVQKIHEFHHKSRYQRDILVSCRKYQASGHMLLSMVATLLKNLFFDRLEWSALIKLYVRNYQTTVIASQRPSCCLFSINNWYLFFSTAMRQREFPCQMCV